MMGASTGNVDTAPPATTSPAPRDAIARLAHELACIRETRGGSAGDMARRLEAGNVVWRELHAALEAEGLTVQPMAWREVEARVEVHGGR